MDAPVGHHSSTMSSDPATAATTAMVAEKKCERRTLTHPPMPVWISQSGCAPPLFTPPMFRDAPVAFQVLERECAILEREMGATAFQKRLRDFSCALFPEDLASSPEERKGALIAYAALRKWMVARGEDVESQT